MKKIMIAALIAVLCCFLTPSVTAANVPKPPDPPLAQLNKLADKLIDQTGKQQLGNARDTIAQISDIFTHLSFDGVTKVEGIQAVSTSIIKTKHAYAPIRLDWNEALYYANQLKLALDSLSHREKPLWLSYRTVMKKDIEEIKRLMVQKQQLSAIDNQLVVLQRHYELIRPALQVSRSPQLVEKMDSIVRFTQQQFNQPVISHTQVSSALNQLDQAFDALFSGEDKDVFLIGGGQVPPPWTLIYGISAIVLASLTFVSWRKYAAEYRIVRKKL